jgi:hypothetical protein
MISMPWREESMRNSIAHSWIVGALAAALVACSSEPSGKSYSSPGQAVDAFVTSLRANDINGLSTVFGRGAERLFRSPDSVADKSLRADFLQLYDAKHELTTRNDGAAVLVIGKDAWPLPIPLVKTADGWVFDTEAGSEEIINRRIGRNELLTIQTVLAVGDAQRDYYRVDRNGDKILEYAQKFRSTPGQRDGLYWRAEPGQPLSPLGELVAAAAEGGYPATSTSLHGYRYRLLTSQGPAASGGAYDYLVRKSQIGGFAVVAYPLEYGESGIMTFIVNHDGVVYQRDFGKDTQAAASEMKTFDPDQNWTRVASSDLQPGLVAAADDQGN